MDPRNQVQGSENLKGSVSGENLHVTSSQIAPSVQPMLFQSLPSPPQVHVPRSNKNKVVIGVVGLIVAVLAVVFLLGRNDSEPTTVSPNYEQSDSSSDQTSDEFVDQYGSFDDFPDSFRSAFLTNCSSSGNYEACLCSLENMESLFTYEEVLTVYYSGEDLTWFYEKITSNCI